MTTKRLVEALGADAFKTMQEAEKGAVDRVGVATRARQRRMAGAPLGVVLRNFGAGFSAISSGVALGKAFPRGRHGRKIGAQTITKPLRRASYCHETLRPTAISAAAS